MRAVSEQQYHVASGFTTFLGSAAFESAVPRNVCSSGVFTDSTPPSNIVYNVSVPEVPAAHLKYVPFGLSEASLCALSNA